MSTSGQDRRSGGGQLEGRTALVTGAAHGIGLASARAMAREGARMVIADIDGESAATAAKELAGRGLKAFDIPVDVGDPKDVQRCREDVGQRVGHVDVLINNAAVFATVPMSRVGYQGLSVDEWV